MARYEIFTAYCGNTNSKAGYTVHDTARRGTGIPGEVGYHDTLEEATAQADALNAEHPESPRQA